MKFIEYCAESEKQNGCMGKEWLWKYWLLTLVITWLSGSCGCPASWESNVLHVTSLGKDKNSKFEVWFLLNVFHFGTILKSKNHNLIHHKLRIICILLKDEKACWNFHYWNYNLVHKHGIFATADLYEAFREMVLKLISSKGFSSTK